MTSLMKKVRGFIRDEEGQGLVEYALILALVAIAVIVALTALGGKVSSTYDKIADELPASVGS